MRPNTRYLERALCWDCQGHSQIGILSLPRILLDSELGVLVIVGGPQYRAGSHRQFTLLSRRLAAEGTPTLRFDMRGMGDSEGPPQSFEQSCPDIAAAVDSLVREVPGLRRVILWGLCDAASAALLYVEATNDPRIAGLVLANPWVRSPQSQAQTKVRHYYRQRLRDASFWRKLLGGGVGLEALREFVGSLLRSHARPSQIGRTTPSYQDRMALGWTRAPRSPTLILSGNDYTAKEFTEYVDGDARWQAAMQSNPPARVELLEANHTFASQAWRAAVEATTIEVLTRLRNTG